MLRFGSLTNRSSVLLSFGIRAPIFASHAAILAARVSLSNQLGRP
jgi:hypothetical protein